MESSNNHDECELDQSFFSDLVHGDTNDVYIESQMEDGVPNTRERAGMGIKELRYKRKAQVAVGRDPCPDTRDWSKAKRLRTDQKGTIVRNDSLPFDVIANKKSAALATWLPEQGLVEVTQMRGNFWRTTGFCTNQKSYLYPEEALLLAERSVILIDYQGERVAYHKLYEDVIDIISLECHLAYLKLKSLDYLVFRHGKGVRSFEGDADVYKYLSEHPDTSLLKAVVSYDVYSHTHKWSKKMMSDPPAARIVVMTGDLTFSGRLMVQLLDESKGIPIIFAAVMPTGHVMLEEFSDSLISLNWENVFAKPIEFRSKIQQSLKGTEKNDQNKVNGKNGRNGESGEKDENGDADHVSSDGQDVDENDADEIDDDDNENEDEDEEENEGADEEESDLESEGENDVDDDEDIGAEGDENNAIGIDIENEVENIAENEVESGVEIDEVIPEVVENSVENSEEESNMLGELVELLDDDSIDFSAAIIVPDRLAEESMNPDRLAEEILVPDRLAEEILVPDRLELEGSGR